MWRLRVPSANFDIWVTLPDPLTWEISIIAEELRASVYSMICVIFFQSVEDVLVFRLKAGV